jgi:hypothetical protein
MSESRYRASRQANWQARGHDRVWGIWDTLVTAWVIRPDLPYTAVVERLRELEEKTVPHQEPVPIEEDQVTPECVAALKQYVEKKTEEGYHCWIDRGPARDRLGVFAVLGLDGKTVTRNYDRDSDRWY